MAKKGASQGRKGKSSRSQEQSPWRAVLAANAETIALIGVVVSGFLAVDLANGDAASPALLRQLCGVGAWPMVVIVLGFSLAVLARPLAERLGWGHLLRQRRLGDPERRQRQDVDQPPAGVRWLFGGDQRWLPNP